MPKTFSPRSGFSILKFLLGTFLFLVVALLVFVTFLLSPTLKWAANSQLPEILGTDASVEDIRLNLWTGNLEIRGVQVTDPTDESGAAKLVSLGDLKIDIAVTSLLSDTIRIQEIGLSNLDANLHRLPDGSFTFEKLRVLEEASGQETVEEPPAEESPGGKAIRIDKIDLNGISASFLDQSSPGQETSYSLKDFSFLSAAITVNPGGAVSTLPTGIELESIKLSDAQFGYFLTALQDSGVVEATAPPAEENTNAAPEPSTETAAAPPASATPEESSPADPIHLKSFEIENFSFNYKDTPLSGAPGELQVSDFTFKVKDLVFDPAEALKEMNDTSVTAEIGFKILQQGEGAEPADFTATFTSSVIRKGIPTASGKIQMTNLEVETLGAAAGQQPQSDVAGSVFDFNIDLEATPDKVSLTQIQLSDRTEPSDANSLLGLESLVIEIDPASLETDTLHLTKISLIKPSLHVQKLADGAFSFDKAKVFDPAEKTEEEAKPKAPQEAPEAEPVEGAGQGIKIDTVSLEGLTASFMDESDATKKVSYELKNFNFLASGITVNPGSSVKTLAPGTQLKTVKFSDAQIEYFVTKLKTDPPPQATADKPIIKEEEEEVIKEELTEDDDKTSESTPADPVYIAEFNIENFTFHYKDEPVNGKPIDVKAIKFYTKANDMTFDPSGVLSEDQDKVFTAELGFQIPQNIEGAGPANFVGVAKSSVISDGIPVTAGQLQMTGFELATLGSLVPQGTQTALGGSGFDLGVRWFVSPDKLDGKAVLTSSNGVKTTISVGGTPENPKISGSDILLNIIGRPGALVQNLTGNALQGGVEVVSGAADAAGKLAKGAGDTVLGFGKGLLNTGKGLLKGDLKEAGKGLEQATVGTVKTAGTAVADSTDAAASGVKGAVDAGTGGSRKKTWREENRKRHDAFEAASKEWLENGVFPPKPKEKHEKVTPDSAERGDDDAQRAADAVKSETTEL